MHNEHLIAGTHIPAYYVHFKLEVVDIEMMGNLFNNEPRIEV